jgi:hypothetical protein
MITNFDDITQELSPEELRIIPFLIGGFKKRTKENPIKAPEIVESVNNQREKLKLPEKYKFSEARLRKISNHIRTNGLLPLIATSSGYFTSNDPEEIQKQIDSLEERASAIQRSADGLREYLQKLKRNNGTSEELPF